MWKLRKKTPLKLSFKAFKNALGIISHIEEKNIKIRPF